MSRTFTVALAGAGSIAKAYLEHLRAQSGVEVVACADPSPVARDRALADHRIPRAYDDVAAMLAGEKHLDAVCVITPNLQHASAAIAALEAGKHVMVEKPMAFDAVQARAMAAAATRAGRKLVVGFQFRFDPRTEFIRKQITAGTLGDICYVRCQAMRRRGIPNRGVFGRKDLQGGGPLIDIGVHVLEMAHYLMGSPQPIAASGSTWTYLGDKPMEAVTKHPDWDWRNYTVEDLAVGQVRFANGSMLRIDTSFAAHIPEDRWDLQVMGTRGGATWDPTKIFTDRDGYMMDVSPAFLPDRHVFGYKVRHFIEVCRDGRENEAPAEHGVMIQEILDGIYASAAAGRELPIGAAAATTA